MKIVVTINTKEDIKKIREIFYKTRDNDYIVIDFESDYSQSKGFILNKCFYSYNKTNVHGERAKRLAQERVKKTHDWRKYADMYCS